MSDLLRSLAGQLRRPEFAAIADADLLRAHVVEHSEAAFAALVDRYGRLVWHWCRRILGPGPDAEDAFQATFLVMSRRAASIRPDAVAGWLHRVSRRVAMRALARRARRQSAEMAASQNRNQSITQHSTEPTASDLLAVLDEEVTRLPERYRTPLMLCFWQGMTQAEAARCLGCSAGSIKGRLERGRRRLAQRLTKRGFGPQSILLAPVALAVVPGDLLGRTATIARSNGEISVAIAALAEHAMAGIGTKMKIAATAIFAAAALTAGVMAQGGAKGTDDPKPATSENPKPAEKQKTQPKVDVYGDPLPEGAIARMGTTRFHYQRPVAAFSKDGKTLVVVDRNGVVYLNDVKTGKQIGTHRIDLPKLKSSGIAVRALSSDGRLLVSVSDDGVVTYDTFTAKQHGRIPIESLEKSEIILAPNGAKLATFVQEGAEHPRASIWDTATGKELCKLKLSRPFSLILHAAFSHDGKLLATVEHGQANLQLWDTVTGKRLRQCEGMGDLQVDFAPDDQTLAVGGYNGVTIYDTKSLKQLIHLPLPNPEGITSLKFSPDGSVLSGGRQLGDLILWDIRKQKIKSRLDTLQVSFQCFSPDGKTLAVWGYESFKDVVELRDVESGKRLHRRPSHEESVSTVAGSNHGSTVASGSSRDPNLRLWDGVSGRQLHELRSRDRSIRSAAISPDGKLAASGGREGTVQLWDLTTGKQLLRYEVTRPYKGSYWVDQLQFSSDGKRLAAVQVSMDDNVSPGMVRVWDVTTKRQIAERPIRADILTRKTTDGGISKTFFPHFRIDPNCEFVTTRVNGQVVVESVASGHEVATIGDNLGSPLVFSADSRLLACSQHQPAKNPSDSPKLLGIAIVETITGKEVQRIEGEGMGAIGFSPDGRFLFARDTKAILVYDVATGMEAFRRNLPAGVGGPSVVLGPGNRAVVTGMPDGTLLVWDMLPEKWKLPPKAASEKPANAQQLWADLMADARTAFHAANLLADSPTDCLTLFRESLKPAPGLDRKEIEKLIGQLDDKQFNVRENAVKELRRKRDEVDPILKQWLEKTQSAEVRRRIKEILTGPVPTPSPERLRELRAVGVLEHIGNADARALLGKLAAGDRNSRLTRAAKAGLLRVEIRK